MLKVCSRGDYLKAKPFSPREERAILAAFGRFAVADVGRKARRSCIVIRMPELGQVSRDQTTELARLASLVTDSGSRKREMHISAGRERVQRAVYAAALSGAFHRNPRLWRATGA